jgi:hypothetical protein
MLQLLVPIVEMSLDEKLKAYLDDPNGSLDLSGLGFGRIDEAHHCKKVASFLSQW